MKKKQKEEKCSSCGTMDGAAGLVFYTDGDIVCSRCRKAGWMKSEEKQEIDAVKNLIKKLESNKGFGKRNCNPILLDCASCRGSLLIGMLYWYLDLIEK